MSLSSGSDDPPSSADLSNIEIHQNNNEEANTAYRHVERCLPISQVNEPVLMGAEQKELERKKKLKAESIRRTRVAEAYERQYRIVIDESTAVRKKKEATYIYSLSGLSVQSEFVEETSRNCLPVIPQRLTMFMIQTLPILGLVTIMQLLQNKKSRDLYETNRRDIAHEPQSDLDPLVINSRKAFWAERVQKWETILKKVKRSRVSMKGVDVCTDVIPDPEDFDKKKHGKLVVEISLIHARKKLYNQEHIVPSKEYQFHWNCRQGPYIDTETGEKIVRPRVGSIADFTYQNSKILDDTGIDALQDLEKRVTAYLKEHFPATMIDVVLDFHFSLSETGTCYSHGSLSVESKTCLDVKNELVDMAEGNMKENGWRVGFVLFVPLCSEGMAIRFMLPDDANKNSFHPESTLYVPFGSALLLRADTAYSDLYGSEKNLRLKALIVPKELSKVLEPGMFAKPDVPKEFDRPELMLFSAVRAIQYCNTNFYGTKQSNKYRDDLFKCASITKSPSARAWLQEYYLGNEDVKNFIPKAMVTRYIRLCNEEYDIIHGAIIGNQTMGDRYRADGTLAKLKYKQEILYGERQENGIPEISQSRYKKYEKEFYDNLNRYIYPCVKEKKDGEEEDDDEDEDNDEEVEENSKKKKQRRLPAITFARRDVLGQSGFEIDPEEKYKFGDSLIDIYEICGHEGPLKATDTQRYQGSMYNMFVKMNQSDMFYTKLSLRYLFKYARQQLQEYGERTDLITVDGWLELFDPEAAKARKEAAATKAKKAENATVKKAKVRAKKNTTTRTMNTRKRKSSS